MKSRLACLLLGLLLSLPSLSIGQTWSPDYIDGRIYVRLSSRSAVSLPDLPGRQAHQMPKAIDALIGLYQIQRVFRPFTRIREEVFTRTYEMNFAQPMQVMELIRDLEALDFVEFAEPIPLVKTLLVPNDPNQGNQWYLNTIKAFQAWDIHLGGNAVIAIADDAVRITHQDLAPNIWVNPGEIPGDGLDNDNNGYIDDVNGYDTADDDGDPNPPASATNSSFTHGTHVAGIASAATNNATGVASIGFNCELMAVKSTADGAANPNVIQTGYASVEYAMVAGADVINMSWGGNGSSATIQTLMNSAFNQGIVLVAAAGNDNTSQQLYPAAYNNVIAVASTAQGDTKSSFSNFGSWVDIAAPGSSIHSTLAGSNSAYGNLSGTSMASPMVAGLCGLMKSYAPASTPTDILNCLQSSADNIDSQNPNFIGQLGDGRINGQAALQCLNPNVAPQANFAFNPGGGCAGAQITFTDLSSPTPSSWNWSFPGGNPASSTQQNPTISYNSPGTYSVSLIVSNAFGSDTLSMSNAISIFSSGLPLPFVEDFESGFGNQGWSIDNPDNGITWELAQVGGTTPGNMAAKMNFFNYNNVGQRDRLDSPPLNLVGFSTISLDFQHAYRRFNTNSSDSLIIYVSTDCGQTFPTRVFAGAENGTGSFATAVTSNQAFTPSQSSQWCLGTVGANCFTVDLSAFAGNNSVVIRFESYSNYQNNLYLDNINISGQSLNQAPVAAFSANTTFGCAPLPVQFTDQSSFSPSSWTWSFPGGNPATSTQQNPQVSYANPGSYDVSLIVSNASGSDTLIETAYITVNGCTPSACDTLDNFNNGTVSLYSYSGGTNFVAGHNGFADRVKAEYFANVNNASFLTAAQLTFGRAEGDSAGSFVTAHVYEDDGPGGNPGTIIASEVLLISDLAADLAAGNPTTVDFGGAVSVNGAFYIGIELNYSPGGGYQDTVALITNLDPETTPATAWEQWSDSSWHSYAESATWDLDIAHAIRAFTSDASPVADFTANVVQGCPGTVVSFANASANASGFQWDFPGGNPGISQDANPVISYDSVGVYDVVLTALGACFTSDIKTKSGFIQILAEPSVSIFNTVDDACGQGNGVASAVATGGSGNYSYVWNTNPVQTTPVATGLTFGTYTVTVTDGNGCTSSATTTIGDTPGPNASIVSWNNESCGLNNGSATVTVTGGTMPVSYLWNTTPVQTTPTATGLPAGTYSVIVTDANNCIDTATVLLTGTPAVNVSVVGNDENCGAANGAATAQVSGGSAPFTYQWNTNPVQTTATATGLSAGTYTVTVTDGNNCVESASVIILNTVQAPQVELGPDISSCGSAMLDAGNPGAAFTWSTGATSQIITVTQSGLYSVSVSAGAGCVGTDSIQVNILPLPVVELGPDSSVCKPYVLDAGNPGASYIWSTGATSQTLTVNQAGLYVVTVTAANGCAATDNINLSLLPDPSAGFTYIANLLSVSFSNSSQNSTNYAWDFGDGNVSNNMNPNHTYAANGNYSVRLVVSNACGSDTVVQVITVNDPALSLGALSFAEVRLYPNPSEGLFQMEVKDSEEQMLSLSLTNALGQEIERETHSFRQHQVKLKLDYRHLAEGMYFLNLTGGGKRWVKKIEIVK